MENKTGNIGVFERMFSGAIGGFLATCAVDQFVEGDNTKGVVASVASVAILARAVSGYCPAYAAIREARAQKILRKLDASDRSLELAQLSDDGATFEELTLPNFEASLVNRNREDDVRLTVGSYVRGPNF